MIRLQGVLGLVFLLGVAWVISEDRKKINYRTVVAGLVLQLTLCLALLKAPLSRELFMFLNRLVLAVDTATTEGSSFVFGFLGGAPLPYDEVKPGMSYVFACKGLPLVIVISALTSLLFYWRILPTVVRAASWLFRKSLGIGGCEALGAAANIFVGMIAAPLFVRPYLKDLSRSEMFAIMTAGMATVAGTVVKLVEQCYQDDARANRRSARPPWRAGGCGSWPWSRIRFGCGHGCTVRSPALGRRPSAGRSTSPSLTRALCHV